MQGSTSTSCIEHVRLHCSAFVYLQSSNFVMVEHPSKVLRVYVSLGKLAWPLVWGDRERIGKHMLGGPNMWFGHMAWCIQASQDFGGRLEGFG
jgi:hypothetical protein